MKAQIKVKRDFAARRGPFSSSLPISHSQFGSGFTLIEIMVVVAIIAVIATAAVPSLYGFVHKEGFHKTLNDVMEACRSARAEAIVRDHTSELIFHPRDGTCEAAATGGYGAWAHSAKIENCTIEMLDVNLKEYKDADSVRVRFFPNGTSDEMTLVLRSDKNEWRTISLEITTGIASMSMGPPKLSKY